MEEYLIRERLRSWIRFDAFQIEVLARICLAAFLGYVLSIADLPANIVPPSFGFLAGIFAPFYAISLPKQAYIVAGTLPAIASGVIMACVLSTGALAAATISSALMCVVLTIITLFSMSLWFGDRFEKGAARAGLFLGFLGLITLSNQSLVQDGIQTEYALSSPIQADSRSLEQLVFESLCHHSQQSTVDCSLERDMLCPDGDCVRSPFTLSDQIPVLGGRPVELLYTNSTSNHFLQVTIPGGLWVLSAMWTGFGPLAIFPGTVIGFCWALACTAVAVLIPPVRTMRSSLSQSLIPTAIDKVSAYLLATEPADDIEKGWATSSFGRESTAEYAMDQDDLVSVWNSVATTKASPLAFEPRLCRAEYLVPVMDKFLRATDELILAAIQVPRIDPDSAHYARECDGFVDSVKLLKQCSMALQANDIQVMQTESEPSSAPVADTPAEALGYVHGRCVQFRDATVEWLEAINSERVEGGSFFSSARIAWKLLLIWARVPMIIVERLLFSLTVPFRPKTWNPRCFLWSLKWTMGLVILFVLTAYCPRFRNFGLTPDSRQMDPVFCGWQLFSYALAWQTTVEGTVKKGLQRVAGTCLGGFLAWLGVLLCSWSRDGNSEPNPYALTAWLTAFATVAGTICLGKGLNAFNGAGYDHGDIGVYFSLVLGLVALEFRLGYGSINDLALNRVVATVTGVLMSMVVANVPPVFRCRNPYLAMDYCASLRTCLGHILRGSAIVHDDGETYSRAIARSLDHAAMKRRRAVFSIKDAGKLSRLPVYQLAGELKEIFNELALIEANLHHLARLVASIREREGILKERIRIQPVLLAMFDRSAELEDDEISREVSRAIIEAEDDRIAVLLSLAKGISDQLRECAERLDELNRRGNQHLPAFLKKISDIDRTYDRGFL